MSNTENLFEKDSSFEENSLEKSSVLVEPDIFLNFSEFARRHSSDIFRYWIYRRMYTPLEQEEKDIDDGFFEDIYCKRAYIQEIIPLPDGDILIGFLDEDTIDDKCSKNVQYCKLSEIRLELYEGDKHNDDEIY